MNFDKRILQFFWASFGMGLAYTIDLIGSNLGVFNLSTEAVTIIGIIIPVITKAIREYCDELNQTNK